MKGGNYVQLATVDSSGAPAVRTVVCRGFVDIGNGGGCSGAIKMITNALSAKVGHITGANPNCEVLWWFPATSEQYRIGGEVVLVGSSGLLPTAKGAQTELLFGLFLLLCPCGVGVGVGHAIPAK